VSDSVWPFRPQAVAAYRDGPQGPAPGGLRPARWPLLALLIFVVGSLVFAASVHVGRAVNGTVIRADGRYLVAVVPGRLHPAPATGAPARLIQRADQPTLRVARVESITTEAAARRWRISATVPRPVTVVLLTGVDRHESVLGPVSIRVADPTLLQALPSFGGGRR
jgi:hypothetical protein